MPLGYERLNERTQRPNSCINFIKPLASSSLEDQTIAKDFLERIAAQCYPVMKKEYISVMALEEYPSNPEFVGRNFNAGECIQLVLKDKAGRWLPFKMVQMVMMHELAHCKQMNHSKFFWQVRNKYAEHMKELWSKKYHGEGLWGRGQDLTDGAFVHDRMPDSADIPEHLCGGTYRRARGKKRKRGQDDGNKPELTYAERQQKRIAKKFGSHGEGHDLGEDVMIRGALEQGKSRPGKPRVANSKRGRELRANAALARFDAAKEQQKAAEKTPQLEEDDESETDSEDEFADGLNILETLERIKDQKGRDLVKVCGDEGEQDEGGQQELDELRTLGMSNVKNDTKGGSSSTNSKRRKIVEHEDSETESEPEQSNHVKKGKFSQPNGTNGPNIATSTKANQSEQIPAPKTSAAPTSPDRNWSWPDEVKNNVVTCPICSLENGPDSSTCMACSHVLKPSLVKHNWRCKSDQCKGTAYINAGDVGRCGLCGALKPANVVESKPMGVLSADVLRWD